MALHPQLGIGWETTKGTLMSHAKGRPERMPESSERAAFQVEADFVADCGHAMHVIFEGTQQLTNQVCPTCGLSYTVEWYNEEKGYPPIRSYPQAPTAHQGA